MKVGVLTKSDLTIEVLPSMVMVGVMTKSYMVEKRLTPHIHTVVLPMPKPHMMKEVATSEPCMLAMIQCQPEDMMIDVEKEV